MVKLMLWMGTELQADLEACQSWNDPCSDQGIWLSIFNSKKRHKILSGRCVASHGRYWIRTSDPFRVKEVRYHCANRPIDES